MALQSLLSPVEMSSRRIVTSASTEPHAALKWAIEVEEATSLEQLASSLYRDEHGTVVDFETLDFKIASGLMKVMQGDFKKRISMDDEEHQLRFGRMLTGRQIWWKIFQHFKISELETSVMEFTDLCNLELRGDNLRGFNKHGLGRYLVGHEAHP